MISQGNGVGFARLDRLVGDSDASSIAAATISALVQRGVSSLVIVCAAHLPFSEVGLVYSTSFGAVPHALQISKFSALDCDTPLNDGFLCALLHFASIQEMSVVLLVVDGRRGENCRENLDYDAAHSAVSLGKAVESLLSSCGGDGAPVTFNEAKARVAFADVQQQQHFLLSSSASSSSVCDDVNSGKTGVGSQVRGARDNACLMFT